MPIYEYSCQSCHRRFSALVGVVAGAAKVACPRCGSKRLIKLVSRFSSPRSEGDHDDLGDDLGDELEGAPEHDYMGDEAADEDEF